jgi:formylglycine-generating enzyme
MSKPFFLLLTLIAPMVLVGACSQPAKPGEMVLVPGGLFKNTKSSLHGKNVGVVDFYIGKYEVTQKEWLDVMGNNPSQFKGDNLPVENVSWYDCVEYCNKKSVKEGLKPCYTIDKNTKDPNNKNGKDDVKWTVTLNDGANGYRLPLEVEWEYAAGGGQASRNQTYAGSDNVNDVAWFWQNSGDKPLSGYWNREVIEKNNNRTKPVGGKAPNELGLFDMSGNVREWCEDWYGDALVNTNGTDRVWRGGGWLGNDQACAPSFRGYAIPIARWNDTGVRVCRNK